jgi:hypothetical protein
MRERLPVQPDPNLGGEISPVGDFITDGRKYHRAVEQGLAAGTYPRSRDVWPPGCSRAGRCAEGHVPHPANVAPERGRYRFFVRPRGRQALPDDDAAAPPGEE